MRFRQFTILTSIAVALTIPAVASTHARRGPSAKASSKTSSKTSSKSASNHPAKPKILGQRTIADERATQIQAALIKAGYLTGEPSGHWDATTEAAIGKMQSDNGWQTKLVPDSRALIKLGLGPAADSPAAVPPSPVAQIQLQ